MKAEVEAGCTVREFTYPATISSCCPANWRDRLAARHACCILATQLFLDFHVCENPGTDRGGAVLRTPLIRQQRGNFDRTFRSDESG
ncbi:hypothetical protein CDAR_580911 [Caerostris darwini]|uniref:Uncharacterized protein n=1 Tax=Caerostris darwini TaxID=1538125 RepID=A0AAV4WNV1_9ARAC|nr:hypothetical protein CDAR_580911 [Caerostris darwini]